MELLRLFPKPQAWKKEEVAAWLESLGLALYLPAFEAAGVQGVDLIGLDADQLKRRLGVVSLGHRTKMLKSIAILKTKAGASLRRDEADDLIDPLQKMRINIDQIYPAKLRIEKKAAQGEKVVDARAKFWTPEDRKMRGAEDLKAKGPENKRMRPPSATKQLSEERERDKGVRSFPVAPPAMGHGRQGATLSLRAHTRDAGLQQVHPDMISRRKFQTKQEKPISRSPPVEDREMEEEEDSEYLQPPAVKLEIIQERIKKLNEEGNFEELIKAWVEYAACVRMQHSDSHPLLVRSHFHLATTYLRLKMIVQALFHFKAADNINQLNPQTDDSLAFRCRILEGMGICETRLGNYQSAHSLLGTAKKICMRRAGRTGDSVMAEEGEEEEVLDDQDGTVASLYVAMSDLYSAQKLFDDAMNYLIKAWELKEASTSGRKDPQIGKLFTAMGTIKRQLLKQMTEQFHVVDAELESSLRNKAEIERKAEGIELAGLDQDLFGLDKDIANLSRQRSELQSNMRICKAEIIEHMNEARKIVQDSKGEDHPDTEKLTELVGKLCSKFLEEEKDAIMRLKPVNKLNSTAEEEVNDWLFKHGIDAVNVSGEEAPVSHIDEAIAKLRGIAQGQHEASV
eukprot:764228-Hanusia_phi.AAC.2